MKERGYWMKDKKVDLFKKVDPLSYQYSDPLNLDPFNAIDVIDTEIGSVIIYRLSRLEEIGIGNISRFPYSIKVLLESILRSIDGKLVTKEDVERLIQRNSKKILYEIPFIPSRVLLQDFTGVPVIVDLAAMRSAMKRMGGDPAKINPVIPADLVIDHSIQVDYYGTSYALSYNEKKEFERNHERYSILRWGQKAFDNLKVIPPGRGIVHQVNLEHLASVVQFKKVNNDIIAYPETLVGTDSHTTMINGLGVLGWGIGGIEAEAVLLGRPYYMPIPDVVGFKLYGELKEGMTATDLVLTITKILREYGVVDKIVEFYGPGLNKLTIPDRATISNMSPEYGATSAFFPIDAETLSYLSITGRKKEHVALVKKYAIEQGLFRTADSLEPIFNENVELDMGTVESILAGPKKPHGSIILDKMRINFQKDMEKTFIRIHGHGLRLEDELPRNVSWLDEGGNYRIEQHTPFGDSSLTRYTEIYNERITDGSVVIAAITSCTNTSNPSVMISAGLLAKKAVEHGLKIRSYVKTSLAPGSRVVTDYLKSSGLLPYLEALGFHIVGYGCTTCIGNSGHIHENIATIIKDNGLVVAAVLSGNRNYEGRINPLIKANYLASPPLVVAFAIAGRVDIDLKNEPLGYDPNGVRVYLKDIWPAQEEIIQIIKDNIDSKIFEEEYPEIFEGTKLWQEFVIPKEELYKWNPESTYIQEPPFFKNFSIKSSEAQNSNLLSQDSKFLSSDIHGARVLALLGDGITTDHISPAGEIPINSVAAKYLISVGVDQKNFNSFGSRRGNHEVMMRGTFSNIQLQNLLLNKEMNKEMNKEIKEGGWTIYFPTGEEISIYDAAMLYKDRNIPLIIIAGKEYGSGSSRDWAAKGTYLLGVRAVIAESYERIHRSNLIGMGVLPLQFKKGDNADTLNIKGNEVFDLLGIENIIPGGKLSVSLRDEKMKVGNDRRFVDRRFEVNVRIDSDIELEYYRNGGILHTFLKNILEKD